MIHGLWIIGIFYTISMISMSHGCFYALGMWAVRLELEDLWEGQDIREEAVEMQPPPAVLADVNSPSH